MAAKAGAKTWRLVPEHRPALREMQILGDVPLAEIPEVEASQAGDQALARNVQGEEAFAALRFLSLHLDHERTSPCTSRPTVFQAT